MGKWAPNKLILREIRELISFVVSFTPIFIISILGNHRIPIHIHYFSEYQLSLPTPKVKAFEDVIPAKEEKKERPAYY